MGRGAKAALGVAVLALIAFFVLASPYNTLVALDEAVTKAKADVEVVIQRRLDLIPNLVETVRGYATHERETLEAVTKARQQWSRPHLDQKLAENQRLTGALGRLLVAVERYPDLKASQNFRSLKDHWRGPRNRIAVPATATMPPSRSTTWPSAASHRHHGQPFGLYSQEGFAAAHEAQSAPKVKFN